MIVVIAVGYSLVTKAPKETGPIKIGFMGPLTGDAASYGESIKKGFDLAVQESGIADKVKAIYEDSKCDGKEAVNAIKKLIEVDKVSAIVGEVCSGATLAAAPIAQQAKVVLISPASTNPKLTEAGEYFFRVVPSDALQGAFAANILKREGVNKLAILYGNEEYGVGFEKVLRENFEATGGAVVASESFQRGATDLRTQLAKIKASDPEAIFIISNSPDSAVAALKQIHELKITARVFGSEGLKSNDIIDGAKELAEGLTVSSVSVGTEDFANLHEVRYGSKPGPFAAQGYDAAMAILLAIKQGALNSEDIKTALETLSFEGATGLIKFDENGEVGGNYDVYVVENGKFIKKAE